MSIDEQPLRPAPPLQPPAAPPLSPDGQYWWSGTEWVPVGAPQQPPHTQQPPAMGMLGGTAGGWPGTPSPYGPPVGPDTGTDGFAIASLVLGIVWLLGLGSLLAVIFGHVALGRVRRSAAGGKGLAIAGLILGYVGVTFVALAIVLPVFLTTTHRASVNDVAVRSELRTAATAEEVYFVDHGAYTTDAAALSGEGFLPTGQADVFVAADANGYCLVAASAMTPHQTAWYVQSDGESSSGPYRSPALAEAACPAAHGAFVPMGG